MANLEHLQQLMTEIGPLIDRIEAIDQDGEDFWLFSFAGDAVLQIEYDDQARKLVFFTDLGVPAEEHRLEIYTALLSLNYLWSETGGLRMAIENAANGPIVQVLDLFTLDLDVSTLATVTENFVDTAFYWRGFIANFRPEETPEDAAALASPGPGGAAIRV